MPKTRIPMISPKIEKRNPRRKVVGRVKIAPIREARAAAMPT
jgi:hypothetical protein